jgi:hypothetical protein
MPQFAETGDKLPQAGFRICGALQVGQCRNREFSGIRVIVSPSAWTRDLAVTTMRPMSAASPRKSRSPKSRSIRILSDIEKPSSLRVKQQKLDPAPSRVKPGELWQGN